MKKAVRTTFLQKRAGVVFCSYDYSRHCFAPIRRLAKGSEGIGRVEVVDVVVGGGCSTGEG